MKRARASALIAGALVVVLGGCAHNRKVSDTAYIARDVNTLYGLAKSTMDKGDYPASAKLFDEV